MPPGLLNSKPPCRRINSPISSKTREGTKLKTWDRKDSSTGNKKEREEKGTFSYFQKPTLTQCWRIAWRSTYETYFGTIVSLSLLRASKASFQRLAHRHHLQPPLRPMVRRSFPRAALNERKSSVTMAIQRNVRSRWRSFAVLVWMDWIILRTRYIFEFSWSREICYYHIATFEKKVFGVNLIRNIPATAWFPASDGGTSQ